MTMMRTVLLTILLAATASLYSQSGYKVGDVAADFRLKNVDGKYYSLADIGNAKGYIVIFTCNHCPYSIAYEDRIIALHEEYAPKGFPVVAINPNDSTVQPQDSWSAMKVRSAEKSFPFLYLLDEKQEVFPVYGATRTPHVYLLQREGNINKVAYIGAIDDNHKDASAVTEHFLSDALNAIMDGRAPAPDYTRAIGCTIKVAQ